MSENFEQLNRRLQQYYAKQTLPPDVLLDMEAVIDGAEAEFDPHRKRSFMRVAPKLEWLSMQMIPKLNLAAAALVLLLSIGATMFLVSQQFGDRKINSVADEIALNHAKQFDSEFFVASIPSLSLSMPLLDFAPVAPRRMQLTNYNVTGARYCTVDNAIAVQVRLEDDNNKSYTLYEFRDMDSFEIKGERVFTVDGIQVTLWQEGDVMMGLAHYIDKL